MRITDSDNCKDVINKNTEKPKKVDYDVIYRMMFKNIMNSMSVMSDEYVCWAIDGLSGDETTNGGENENE